MRRLPNILITGTPGTGKSTLSSELSDQSSLEWINIGQVARENNFFEEYDENLECHVLDEDRLIDELEEKMQEGGKIVDYHGCDLFPEEWFDIVFVLTTDNTILYDRLDRRGYTGKKMENNIQCEIFGTLVEEAKNAYKENIVHELKSNTPDDMLLNIEQILHWIDYYKEQHSNG
ncbi:hypothetical protein TNCT_259541 [Trichonephila clavata]|uniref:Adenylate kinase isoenzyme 6 homolog n=1 Tax=Trichonephila clavata TaxID=2740835 RepID=A0A8X6H330_TRICU|nr:hypothetical protein TNCT_259541 [Trichonephila clavata]